ncbi:MAG TPA: pyruvate kinase [Bryobacteraceae bacterium]|nr:pyruvate kinase [Bryobacteraceae bacterium]
MPNTKIVVTLGPATDVPGILPRLIEAGADVFRLNMSHGTQEEHAARIEAVRRESAAVGRFAGILLDLQGPKIRLGKFNSGGCVLATGTEFVITAEDVPGDCSRAHTSYAGLARQVRPGDRILLADGAVELQVIETDGVAVRTRVVSGGPIASNRGINLPGVSTGIPCLTEKDLADLEFGLAAGVDMVALSFVRTAWDVRRLRERVGTNGPAVVAKIEKPQGWENIEEILDVSDGVMVARGDLGVEVALEKVPRIQKSIIRRARAKGRFVITATQMLESMIDHASPTRAEVSDVANAIYDGTDAVMLSGETSIGKYPVEAVSLMDRIAAESDASVRSMGYQEMPAAPDRTVAAALADAAYRVAHEAGVVAIVVFTASGSSARLISRYRPPVAIYAVTPALTVARQLSINYGVTPVLAPHVASTDEMLAQMDSLMTERRYLKHGDMVLFVAGQPVGRPGTTNMLKLHRIGDA